MFVCFLFVIFPIFVDIIIIFINGDLESTCNYNKKNINTHKCQLLEGYLGMKYKHRM